MCLSIRLWEAFVPAYFHENQAKVEIKSKKSRRKYSTKAQRRARQSPAEAVEGKTEETSIHPVTGQFKQQEVVTSSKQESSVESRHPPEESSRTASEPRGGKGGGTRQAQTVTQKLEAMTADHNTKHALIGSGKLFSVVSINVNGAARVRKAGGAAQFAEAMLSLRAKHDAKL